MVKHFVEISDEAFEILNAHKHIGGSPGTDAEEMDELFSIAEQAWWFPPKSKAVEAIGRIKSRLTLRSE